MTLFPIIVMIYRMDYRHTILKYLFFYFCLKFTVEFTMLYMASQRQSNLHFYNAYILASFYLLAMAFYAAYDEEMGKLLVVVVCSVFTAVFVFDWLSVGMERSTQISGTLHSVFIGMFILRYFWEIKSSLKVPSLLSYPFFWACSGLLLYYSALVIVSPLHHRLNRWGSTHDFDFIMLVPAFIDIFYMLIMSFAFWRSE